MGNLALLSMDPATDHGLLFGALAQSSIDVFDAVALSLTCWRVRWWLKQHLALHPAKLPLLTRWLQRTHTLKRDELYYRLLTLGVREQMPGHVTLGVRSVYCMWFRRTPSAIHTVHIRFGRRDCANHCFDIYTSAGFHMFPMRQLIRWIACRLALVEQAYNQLAEDDQEPALRDARAARRMLLDKKPVYYASSPPTHVTKPWWRC